MKVKRTPVIDDGEQIGTIAYFPQDQGWRAWSDSRIHGYNQKYVGIFGDQTKAEEALKRLYWQGTTIKGVQLQLQGQTIPPPKVADMASVAAAMYRDAHKLSPEDQARLFVFGMRLAPFLLRLLKEELAQEGGQGQE